MTDIVLADWYISLVDDCKAVITEALYLSNWEKVIGYHAVGKRIATDANFKKHGKGNLSSLSGLARNLSTSPRTIYRAVQFYEKYPDVKSLVSELPDGKSITWNKIVTKLLPAPPDELSDTDESVSCFCPTCGREHRKATK